MKKLNKLVLRKEVVANLSNQDMNQLKGGTCSAFVGASCVEETISLIDKYECLPPLKTSDRDYTCPGGPTGYGGNTTPPRCCGYGCCETLVC